MTITYIILLNNTNYVYHYTVYREVKWNLKRVSKMYTGTIFIINDKATKAYISNLYRLLTVKHWRTEELYSLRWALSPAFSSPTKPNQVCVIGVQLIPQYWASSARTGAPRWTNIKVINQSMQEVRAAVTLWNDVTFFYSAQKIFFSPYKIPTNTVRLFIFFLWHRDKPNMMHSDIFFYA